MTMPTQEPSAQILTERSSSFNRAEFRQSPRNKASNTGIVFNRDVESLENLTCTKASAVHHVRHSSLDSHPSALHPINLNSKFDYFCSPTSPATASAKVSIVVDDQADKESSFFSAPYTQREGGGEPQEELSLEPHESLLQDAQEESVSTSLSVGSKSPREHLDFILWRNAAFCLPEARDLMSGSTRSGSQRRGEVLSESKLVGNGKQSACLNHMEELLPAKDEGLLSSKKNFSSEDEGVLPHSIESSRPLVTPAISTVESPIAAAEDSVARQSSIGSSLSVHNTSAITHTHAHHFEEFAKEEPLMSSEAQSCCLDFDSHEMEASAASDCKIPAEKMQDMEITPKEINEERKSEQEMDKNPKGLLSSSHSYGEVHQEAASMAAEEVQIRAELELEIEKDLEREIKTKIYLLSRRLEELKVLKAIRHPNQEQSKSHLEEGSSFSSNGQEDHVHTATTEASAAPLPRSPPSIESSKKRSKVEHSQAEKTSARVILASSKKHLTSEENDKNASSSHANTPLTSWRKFATASGWAPHTKDSSSKPPSSDGSLKSVKISKHSIDGLSATSKPKVNVESTASFKQDHQSWTGIASSKKFDWIRTLRSAAASTPRVSSARTDGGEESSTFLPSSKEAICGNVARILFTDDGLSTPRRTMVKPQRREICSTPLAGSSKRSVFSSTKTHNMHADMVVSTPRVRSITPASLKDNHGSSSASVKRLNQKPPSGIQAIRDPMRSRTPTEPRQAKVNTPSSKPSSVSRASPQQASSKVSQIEKKSTMGVPASTNQIGPMKNGSPMQAEKHKRTEIGLLNSSARNAGSKEIKNTPAKTPSKQVSSTSKSRMASATKPVNSTPQVNKTARIAPSPSSNLAKRQSNTPLKRIGASTTREEVASRH